MEDTTTHSPNQDTTIQLGDILKLIAPADERIHEKLFYVNYIDTEKADLLESDGEKYTMYIEKDGTLRNKSIASIDGDKQPPDFLKALTNSDFAFLILPAKALALALLCRSTYSCPSDSLSPTSLRRSLSSTLVEVTALRYFSLKTNTSDNI